VIEAWRIVTWSRRDVAMTGEAAKKHPGRWNPRGARAVYMADSSGLAVLEMWIHLDPARTALHFALIRISIPNDLGILEPRPAELPAGWRRNPPPASTRALGHRWLKDRRAPLLRVPSVLVPYATNLILNPDHPLASRVAAHKPERFRLDLQMMT
jgi:RES domain-containing protein